MDESPRKDGGQIDSHYLIDPDCCDGIRGSTIQRTEGAGHGDAAASCDRGERWITGSTVGSSKQDVRDR